MDRPGLLLRGMHGMGDNLHQRALVRRLMKTHSVWLETSWAALYHDLIADGLHVLHKKTILRTQTKNAKREAAKFHKGPPPLKAAARQIHYTGAMVRKAGSVLGAMLASVGLDTSDVDFRLPVPDEWLAKADALIAKWRPTKPILIYRPLVVRREWHFTGRNADERAYAEVFATIRDRYFVVSIADLVPGVEWIVSDPVAAHVELHHGELEFERLAALVYRAELVFASPGFVVPLAQAVGTPVVCMFGGYENSASFSAGGTFTPYLGLDVINPCQCFVHNHKCDKRMDVPKACAQLKVFIDATARHREKIHPIAKPEIPTAPLPADGRTGNAALAGL
jgi:hypothetical protein